MPPLVLVAAVPLLLAGLSACGSASAVGRQVATSAEDALEQQIGVRPDITCPKDLKAKVGANDPVHADRRRATRPKYGVTVTVTVGRRQQRELRRPGRRAAGGLRGGYPFVRRWAGCRAWRPPRAPTC